MGKNEKNELKEEQKKTCKSSRENTEKVHVEPLNRA